VSIHGVSKDVLVQEQALDKVVSGLEVKVVGEDWWHSERADADAGVEQVVPQLNVGVALQKLHRHWQKTLVWGHFLLRNDPTVVQTKNQLIFQAACSVARQELRVNHRDYGVFVLEAG